MYAVTVAKRLSAYDFYDHSESWEHDHDTDWDRY